MDIKKNILRTRRLSKSIRKVPLKQIYLRIVNLLKDDAKRSGVVGRLVGWSVGQLVGRWVCHNFIKVGKLYFHAPIGAIVDGLSHTVP